VFPLYTKIMGKFFSAEHPDLYDTLLDYHREILLLHRTYRWKDSVLLLALDFHQEAITKGPLIAANWEIPRRYTDQYCQPQFATAHATRPATQARQSSNADVSTQHCFRFNGNGCNWASCPRRHACQVCQSADHGARNHPK
jgi:hypothetical protein